MPAYAPQTLSLSLAGSTTPAAWTHWSGNPLTFSVSLTGSTDFTSCTLLRVEMHTRRDSAEDGDSLLEYVEEANPASEPTALTFTGAQLNGLIADGSTSRRLWVCVVGYVDGSKYTFGSGWLTLLRDNYSGDSDTAHTPADNNFVTESQLNAVAAVLYTEQTLTSDQQTQARTNISAAKSGAVTGSGLTMATARLLGRTTESTGATEEISIGSGLSLSGGTLSCTVSASSAWGGITGTLSDQTDLITALNTKAAKSGATFTGTVTVGGEAPDFYGLALVPGTGTMTVSRATLGNTEYAQVSPTLIRIAGSVDSAGLELYRGGMEIINTSGFGAIIGSSTITADRTFAFPNRDGTFLTEASNTVIQGGADAASPSAQYNKVANVATGTSNTAGVPRYIDGCQGTGIGEGGSIILRTAAAGSSGSSQNSLATTATFDSTGLLAIDGVGYSAISCRYGTQPRAEYGCNGAFFTSEAFIFWASSSTNHASGRDTSIRRAAAGVVGVAGSSDSTGAAVEFLEMTAPSAPGSNKVRLYAEDNGAGKTRLMALFPSGAAQQVAIEP